LLIGKKKRGGKLGPKGEESYIIPRKGILFPWGEVTGLEKGGKEIEEEKGGRF